jgi:hypothetical protein
MKTRLGFALGLLAGACLLGCLAADTARPDLEANLEAHVAYLASEELEGRLVGTAGIEKAGKYIARQLEEIGLEPAFGESYFQEFEMELGFHLKSEPVLRIGETDLKYSEDFSVLPFSGSGSLDTATAQHLGGGPRDLPRRRIAVALIHESIEEERWTMTGRDGLAEWMRDACGKVPSWGAEAIVFVSGRHGDSEAPLHHFALSRAYRPVGIPALEVREDALGRALAAVGVSLEGIVAEPTSGIHALRIPVWVEWSLEVSLEPGKVTVRNVGGMLRGDGPECFVIGAHYDHLGYGDIASSTPWRREIHPGADDNASGVAGVIEIARILASYNRPERSLVFLAFTAEELGALGSEYYCKNAPYPIETTITMMNLDTVGRLDEEKLIVFGARSAEEFGGLLREAVEGHNLDIIEKEEIYGFSDQNPFYSRGVPALHLFTGAHDDYHSPDDVREKINFEGLASITSFAADFASLIAFNPTKLTPVVIEPDTPVSSSRGKGAHLGIIPDFTYAGTGVGIKGTVPGSPAEEAGLRDGDVIVGIDNRSIADLKALMMFLAAKNPGDSIEIQVMRGSTVEAVGATLSVRKPREQRD